MYYLSYGFLKVDERNRAIRITVSESDDGLRWRRLMRKDGNGEETNVVFESNRRDFPQDCFLEGVYGTMIQTVAASAPVQFSLVDVFRKYTETPKMEFCMAETSLSDVEDALLYLSKIGSMKLEGGFLVLYSGMEVKRLILDNKIRYKADDYRSLSEYYKQKIQQIHIVGEYANLMVKDYDAALQFVHDYFEMDFKRFIAKYFKGERTKEIDRNITPEKYHQLFGELSDMQAQIINDSDSRYIVVAAGPGSGKTRVLVHKSASLLLLEDIKHEQLLNASAFITLQRCAFSCAS